MNNLPVDPVGDLAQLSITLHEVYVNHVEAGFTADQSMQLVLAWYNYLLSKLPDSHGK